MSKFGRGSAFSVRLHQYVKLFLVVLIKTVGEYRVDIEVLVKDEAISYVLFVLRIEDGCSLF